MRFVDNNDNTITDTKTSLMWQKKGSDKEMTWERAHAYAESGNEDDPRGWRLPTIEELISLVDYTRYYPAIDPIFECRSNYYWSSSTYAYNPDDAWYVNFYDGNVDASDKSDGNDSYVRCVREKDA